MSRSYWLSVFAAVGLALLVSTSLAWSAEEAELPQDGQADEQEEQQPVPAQPEQQPAVEAPAIAPIAAPSSASGGPEEREPQAEGQTNAPHGFWWDTPAQWIMAIAGIIALGVSGYGIVLLRRTWIATRDTAKQAEAATDVARIIGEAQVRAYVQIGRVRAVMKKHSGVGYGDSPEFSIEVTNSGNSPARAFRWNVKTAYLYVNSLVELRGNTDVGPREWGVDIASRGTLNATNHCLPSYLRQDDAQAFRTGDLHMAVTIETAFIDVFGTEINDRGNFMGHFPTGDIGKHVELQRVPIGAETVALQAALHREAMMKQPKAFNDQSDSDKPA